MYVRLKNRGSIRKGMQSIEGSDPRVVKIKALPPLLMGYSQKQKRNALAGSKSAKPTMLSSALLTI
jgi:hypothetical protein